MSHDCATSCTQVPVIEMSCPAANSRKLRCRRERRVTGSTGWDLRETGRTRDRAAKVISDGGSGRTPDRRPLGIGVRWSKRSHPTRRETAMKRTETPYALMREVDMSYEEAERRIREELASQGFGVLTEIDVRATLKKKLDVEFPPYVILGACNPSLAH